MKTNKNNLQQSGQLQLIFDNSFKQYHVWVRIKEKYLKEMKYIMINIHFAEILSNHEI